ncbi:MAG: hypothetical protein ABIG89_03120 [Candidatus Woesearchaeota archaeon]
MKKKSQVSTEYIIIFGLAMLIIIIGTYSYFNLSKSGFADRQECIIAVPGIECHGFSKYYQIHYGIDALGCKWHQEPITGMVEKECSTTTVFSNKLIKACNPDTKPNNCVKFTIKNTFHEPITLYGIKIDGYPNTKTWFGIESQAPVYVPSTSLTLDKGESEEIIVYFDSIIDGSFTPNSKLKTDFTIEFTKGSASTGTLKDKIKGYMTGKLFPLPH